MILDVYVRVNYDNDQKFAILVDWSQIIWTYLVMG